MQQLLQKQLLKELYGEGEGNFLSITKEMAKNVRRLLDNNPNTPVPLSEIVALLEKQGANDCDIIAALSNAHAFLS